MIRPTVCALLVLVVMTATLPVIADEGRRLPMIGAAVPVDQATDAPYQGALREGLRQLGYVDSKNYRFVARYANGDPARPSSRSLSSFEWMSSLAMLAF